MTISLIAIGSVMALCWVFGIVCDRIFTRWFDSLREPQNEPQRHACDTCKYEDTNPNESPCKECAEDDMDLWEPFDM